MLGTDLSIFHSCHLPFMMALWNRHYCYPYFAEEGKSCRGVKWLALDHLDGISKHLFNMEVDALIDQQMLKVVVHASRLKSQERNNRSKCGSSFPLVQFLSPCHLYPTPHPLLHPSFRDKEKVNETFLKSKLLISRDNPLTQKLNTVKGRWGLISIYSYSIMVISVDIYEAGRQRVD